MGNATNCSEYCSDQEVHNQTFRHAADDPKLAPPPMSAPHVGRSHRSANNDPDAVSKANMSYEHYRQVREQHAGGSGHAGAECDVQGVPSISDLLEHRVEELPDGSRFEGQFRGKARHGRGKFTWATGGCYDGQFCENDMHGTGTYRWSDGSSYTGNWQRNALGPDGVMKWNDGRVYEGQFLHGKKHGEGRLTWPDGRWYSGSWEAGKQHGMGLTCTGKGPPAQSQWEHGKLVRWIDKGQS